MELTVFFTVLSGVFTFVTGQIIVKLIVDPVNDMKKTIGQISHTLIERAAIIGNPGLSEMEVMLGTSEELRALSSKLQAHLYLVPKYSITARIFRLPTFKQVSDASTELIGLSNSVFRSTPDVYEVNAKRVEKICDSLSIYLPPERRWPKDNQ